MPPTSGQETSRPCWLAWSQWTKTPSPAAANQSSIPEVSQYTRQGNISGQRLLTNSTIDQLREEPQVPQALDTHTLPLLPLTNGVVLPGMVVTMALETNEAKAAAEAARLADGRLLLVPRVDG